MNANRLNLWLAVSLLIATGCGGARTQLNELETAETGGSAAGDTASLGGGTGFGGSPAVGGMGGMAGQGGPGGLTAEAGSIAPGGAVPFGGTTFFGGYIGTAGGTAMLGGSVGTSGGTTALGGHVNTGGAFPFGGSTPSIGGYSGFGGSIVLGGHGGTVPLGGSTASHGGTVVPLGGSTVFGGSIASHGGTVPLGGTVVGGHGGTAGTGGAGGTAGTTSCPGLASNEELIDDMNDGDRFIPQVNGRAGAWKDRDDGTPGSTMFPDPSGPFTMTNTGDACRQYAAYAYGGPFVDDGPVVYFGIGGPYDASKYDGITFWAKMDRGTSSGLRVAFPDKDTQPDGGLCDVSSSGPTMCYDHYGSHIALTTTWAKYSVSFSSLTHGGWGRGGTGFDRSTIYEVQFQIPVDATFGVWIDDVAFFVLFEH